MAVEHDPLLSLCLRQILVAEQHCIGPKLLKGRSHMILLNLYSLSFQREWRYGGVATWESSQLPSRVYCHKVILSFSLFLGIVSFWLFTWKFASVHKHRCWVEPQWQDFIMAILRSFLFFFGSIWLYSQSQRHQVWRVWLHCLPERGPYMGNAYSAIFFLTLIWHRYLPLTFKVEFHLRTYWAVLSSGHWRQFIVHLQDSVH